MKEVKEKKNNILLEAFDALFIMILCFATLFSAMMLKGTSSGGIDYSLNFKTLSLTIIVLIVSQCIFLLY